MIVSAFCGTGKTTLCEKYNFISEVEGWKFHGEDFPDNYISEIFKNENNHELTLIDTDKRVLDKLCSKIEMTVVFPKLSLKQEYLNRYKQRGSSDDFIETLEEYWNDWINELKRRNDCLKVVLKSNQFLEDKLKQEMLLK
jgi:predicted KAP-like P-loop ATPase